MTAGMHGIVGELEAEQAALDDLLAPLAPSDWLRPTPAAGWDVRDSVSHLAATDELALDCVAGTGVGALQRLAGRGLTPEQLTREQADRGRGKGPEEMLAWWRSVRGELSAALLRLDPADRVPWGAGPMAARSFATARLMECWAHGLDCFAAVGREPRDTDRLRHVCHLAYRALPYAFQYAGQPMPAPLDSLRLELTGPGGDAWMFGSASAEQTISGTAGEWARVAVQRMPASSARSLRADGPLAEQALRVARAYV